MSRARDFADLAGSADAGGLTGRNMVINGSFAVSQRGTSETSVTSGGYKKAPDRWNIAMSSAGTWTVSQSTTVPSGEGFSHSYKFDCTTADASLSAGDHLILAHYIEAQNVAHLGYGTSSAKKLTLSFWVRSAKTGTYVLELLRNDADRHIAQTYTISSADTWERKTLTFDADTGGAAIPYDNGRGFEVNFWLAAGSTFSGGTLATSWASTTSANRAAGVVNLADSTSNDWYVTGVQLEVGEKATPFEHRSFGEEMTRCERYLQRFVAVQNYTAFSVAFSSGATTAKGHLKFNGKMRSNPTITQSNTGFNYGPQVAFSSFNTLYTGNDLSWIDMNIGSVGSAGQIGNWNANNNAAAYVQMDAEL